MENTKTKGEKQTEWDYISVYTRADAIRDGILCDVSEMAREVGFRFPVALTANVYARYVEVPNNVIGQDRQGRLWDILWMCRAEINRCIDNRDELMFSLVVRNNDRAVKPVLLKSVCSSGDDGEPVITIMLPGED